MKGLPLDALGKKVCIMHFEHRLGDALGLAQSDGESCSLHQIPPEWLDTDVSKGLSAGEADERRKLSGYNELERCVASPTSLPGHNVQDFAH